MKYAIAIAAMLVLALCTEPRAQQATPAPSIITEAQAYKQLLDEANMRLVAAASQLSSAQAELVRLRAENADLHKKLDKPPESVKK